VTRRGGLLADLAVFESGIFKLRMSRDEPSRRKWTAAARPGRSGAGRESNIDRHLLPAGRNGIMGGLMCILFRKGVNNE